MKSKNIRMECDLVDGQVVFYVPGHLPTGFTTEQKSLDGFMNGNGAAFSRNGVYRYLLWRIWDKSRPLVNWLLLNPSTADETKDDNTMKKCTKLANYWGYGGHITTNIFAFRSTQPSLLKTADDPVGPVNIACIGFAARSCRKVICGWGQWGRINNRGNEVLRELRDHGVKPYMLRMGANGQPWHPLYLPDAPKTHPVPVPEP